LGQCKTHKTEIYYTGFNTKYGHEIREALGGKGVDVVLNSLTSEGFKEATLSVCNPGARFIEMSKLNVWNDEEVAALRPDVKYDIADLTKSTREEVLDYLDQVKTYTEETRLKPLPYVRFHAEDIRGALSFLQKAKHIGKIMCVMPEPVSSSGGIRWENKFFNDKSTYLITGGVGGIGLEVAKWMVGSGAKHVFLVGRNPPGEYAMSVIEALNSSEKGGNVQTLQCDVGDYNQCKAMLEEISRPERNLPLLRGIMHAAGVLSDGSYDSQTWEKYVTAFNPKVNGGWNLHQLTLDCPLQHFVMFSSIAALLGSIGQSNHCSARCFGTLSALCGPSSINYQLGSVGSDWRRYQFGNILGQTVQYYSSDIFFGSGSSRTTCTASSWRNGYHLLSEATTL
jgi:hypothetical protein